METQSQDQIRLRWTSHQGTLVSMFDALLSSESMVDVTLACGEGQYIRAHKIVLTACSPYFQELLNLDNNKHPIIFLRNVKYSEAKSLVQYMYRGEMNIPQDELPSLLRVAQELKIRGLAEIEPVNNASETLILPDFPRILCSEGGVDLLSTKRTLETSHHCTHEDEVIIRNSQQQPPTPRPSSPSARVDETPPLKKSRMDYASYIAPHAFIAAQTQDMFRSVQIPSTVEMLSQLSVPNEVASKLRDSHEDKDMYGIRSSQNQEFLDPLDNSSQSTADVVLKCETVDLLDSDSEGEGGNEEDDNSTSLSLSDTGRRSRKSGDNSESETSFNQVLNTSGVDSSSRNQNLESGLFLCQMCQKWFQTAKTLHKHCLYDCANVPPKFHCKLCNYKTRRGYQLRSHYVSAHPEFLMAR